MDLRTRKSRRQARRPFPPPEPGQDFLILKTRVARGGLVNPAPFDGRVVRTSATLLADAPEPTSDVLQFRDVRFARVEAETGLLDGRVRRGRVPSPYPDVYALRGRVVRDALVPELLKGSAFRTQPTLLAGEPDIETPHHRRQTVQRPPTPDMLRGGTRRTRFLVEDPPSVVVNNRPRATQVASLVPIELIEGRGRTRRGRVFADEVVDAVPQRRIVAGAQIVFHGRVVRGWLYPSGEDGPVAPCPERPPVLDETQSGPLAVEAADSQPPYIDEDAPTQAPYPDECR